VDKPILCNPYLEPTEYWLYDTATGEANRAPGRRPAGYYYRTERTIAEQQLRLLAEENWEELRLVNALREDVKRWRASNYEGATNVTRELLRYWWREDRYRRLFYCQLEAAETVIFLSEIRAGGKRVRFNPRLTDEGLAKLVDTPLEPGLLPLTRYGCKMATGAGKTVVMAMLIAWSLCNRGRFPSDERFPAAVLVVCPNLTVKERLQVLRPDDPKNYYADFDMVPTQLRPLMQNGKVMVTNWHLFAPESEHSENGRSYVVVNKGPESPEAFARRVLGDLHDQAPILVFNDEGHHCYRPAPLEDQDGVTGEEAQRAKSDREVATVWVSGLDWINQACGIRMCVDMSATPFHIRGSGYPEGSPFPWLVSDFGLVDAIESGIVKIPRIPVSDTTGRPEPRYFRLWRAINDGLQPGEKLPGRAGKPKPDVVWREAEPALNTLMGQWIERFQYLQEGSTGQDRTPPALIIVCDNTDIAEVLYRNISGEETVQTVDDVEEDEEAEQEEPQPRRRRRSRTRIVYGNGKIFSEYFSNREGLRRTIRIDTKLLAAAEAGDGTQTRQQAAEELRKIVSTVGKAGEPGEQVRCVVSVQMLTEGWDANNVTHILGLRAFDSQLLCEQVVGRGLRRMDYTPDPDTGLLTEEYVDVYGIPFSVIPFKGRPVRKAEPDDRPKWHVRALEERQAYEIRFPVVEGYTFALRRNIIKADVDKMEALQIEPNLEPTAVFVKPTVGYQTGRPSALGPGQFEEQNRDAYYRSTHVQAIEFEIARHIVAALVGVDGQGVDPRSRLRGMAVSRHQLFPQVFRVVDQYLGRKVDWRGQNHCELGHEKYVQRMVERMLAAIEPDDAQGELPLMPVLNRYKPIGTTADVNFKTIRAVHGTERSHINQVVLDTQTWESAAAFRLEQSDVVACYARNDHLEFTIPYEYLGVSHHYEPDYLVRLTDRRTLILEIKGYEDDQDKAKHQAAQRWVSAVNNWGQLGLWGFHVCKDPQVLGRELAYLVLHSAIPGAAQEV
jgi:type III restriction enzyme